MRRYLDLMKEVLECGAVRDDRTGTGTRSLFGERLVFDLQEGFPLVTTKKVHLKSVIYELLWFIRGDTNVNYLQDHGVSIWNEWADATGDLGPIYGAQWRRWRANDGEVIDQLAQVIEEIKSNPTSRRLIVSAWNPGDLDDMALPPCHLFFQFYVDGDKLSCQLYQRSADLFLGVPFNIASYAFLTHMVAAVTGLKPGRLIQVYGDVHLYANHLEQARLQLSREPRALPRLNLRRNPDSIDDFVYDDFEITGYDPHPSIKAPVAV